MDKLHYLYQQREQKKKAYKKGERTQRRLFNVWNGVLVGAYACIGLAVLGLMMIFGPVAKVEAEYRVKSVLSAVQVPSGGLMDFLVPNISFDLVRGEIAGEYGIVIPKLFIQEKVVPNVDPTEKSAYMPALKQGIAHAAGTNLPGEGELGYYFAHSSGLDAPLHGGRAVFYLLNKLDNGDEVRIYKDGKKHTYAVVDKRVTSADDLSFLEQDSDEERIVLQTCWPVGTSSKRLLVTAERV